MNTDLENVLKRLLDQGFTLQLDKTKCLKLSIQNCSQQDVEQLEQQLHALQDYEESKPNNYSRYFDAITGSALYKPGNPQLAIVQVAKNYQLDVNALKEAFKNR